MRDDPAREPTRAAGRDAPRDATHANAAPEQANKGHIHVQDLSIRFGDAATGTEAVSNVSMEVQPGEFVSVIGPSGCGKSTLLNAVAGFIRPTSGTLRVDGVPVEKPGADRGVVFQQYSLFPWMTVRANVEFGLKVRGISKFQRESAARTLLGLAGLLSFENHYPAQLSGGMKQRVGIVRALATSPQVLLMDEPFGALDAQTRVVMQQILTNIWQKFRISVLFITHDIDEAVFLSDRIYVMTARPGTIKAVIQIPLRRPRTTDMTTSDVYLDLKKRILELIREESLKAMGGELKDGGLTGFGMDVGPQGVTDKLA
ncbi:MAG: ABC transporter ATP-binding protein [Gammaproteobacteria bacterium]|nr:ABC transporter ATP-binding protein [Gammaproteobacteria bacterium]